MSLRVVRFCRIRSLGGRCFRLGHSEGYDDARNSSDKERSREANDPIACDVTASGAARAQDNEICGELKVSEFGGGEEAVVIVSHVVRITRAAGREGDRTRDFASHGV